MKLREKRLSSVTVKDALKCVRRCEMFCIPAFEVQAVTGPCFHKGRPKVLSSKFQTVQNRTKTKSNM